MRRCAAFLLAFACTPKHVTPAASAPASSASSSVAMNTPPPASAPAVHPAPGIVPVALPGGGPDGIRMDFLIFDPSTKSVWAPAGNTGAVDVVDAQGTVKQVTGFPTQEMERHGNKMIVGPSSVTIGQGVIYVGNRGDFSVCAVDPKTLTRGTCGKLDSMPDAIAFVPSTKEVWVTTPRDKSIRILDGKTLAQTEKLSFDGEPEGYAIDLQRGRFYTNEENLDKTLSIDIKTHKTVATWAPSCGEEGPHGLALDEPGGFLFIACSTKMESMDVGHDGAVLSSVDTGDGVDNLDYAPARRELVAGAAKDAKVTFAKVDAAGKLTSVAQLTTADGARNGVIADDGRVFLAHTKGSELLVVPLPAGF
jgi:DNA-binding beta-propeller fold protein YncE